MPYIFADLNRYEYFHKHKSYDENCKNKSNVNKTKNTSMLRFSLGFSTYKRNPSIIITVFEKVLLKYAHSST